jgi:hypothetical protein
MRIYTRKKIRITAIVTQNTKKINTLVRKSVNKIKKSALFLLIKSILGRFLLRKPDLSAAAAIYPPQLTLIKLSFLLDLNFSNYASGS